MSFAYILHWYLLLEKVLNIKGNFYKVITCKNSCNTLLHIYEKKSKTIKGKVTQMNTDGVLVYISYFVKCTCYV